MMLCFTHDLGYLVERSDYLDNHKSTGELFIFNCKQHFCKKSQKK